MEGATIFVTLEPCTHSGKTPPCTDLLKAKKIARVVIGAREDNHVAAGGVKQLQEAGIVVKSGVLEKSLLLPWACEAKTFFLGQSRHGWQRIFDGKGRYTFSDFRRKSGGVYPPAPTAM